MFGLLLRAVTVLGALGCGAALPPVVLVPGLIGSQFKAKLTGVVDPPSRFCARKTDDWFTAWLSVTELVPVRKDCLLHNLELHYDTVRGEYQNTTGVMIDAHVDWGGTGGIEALDPSLKSVTGYYATMIEGLVKLGYKRGKDLHGAPYDWRLAPDAHVRPGAYYDLLQQLIETSVARNGNERATIVAHSLGCPTALMFLHSRTAEWRAKYVKAFLPIAGVWGGSASMPIALVSGYTFGVPFVPSDYLKEVQSTSASGMFLMPVADSFGPAAARAGGPSTMEGEERAGGGEEAASGSADPVVVTPSKSYGPGDWEEMLVALGENGTLAMLKSIQRSGLGLQDALPPPGVEASVIIYGHGIKTPRRVEYAKDFSPGFDQPYKKVMYADGDDIVNLESSMRAQQRWGSLANVSFVGFANVSHFDLVLDSRVIQLVANVSLGRGGSSTAAAAATAAALGGKRSTRGAGQGLRNGPALQEWWVPDDGSRARKTSDDDAARAMAFEAGELAAVALGAYELRGEFGSHEQP